MALPPHQLQVGPVIVHLLLLLLLLVVAPPVPPVPGEPAVPPVPLLATPPVPVLATPPVPVEPATPVLAELLLLLDFTALVPPVVALVVLAPPDPELPADPVCPVAPAWAPADRAVEPALEVVLRELSPSPQPPMSPKHATNPQTVKTLPLGLVDFIDNLPEQ